MGNATRFKFRLVQQDGQLQRGKACTGRLEGDTIFLEDTPLGLSDILYSNRRWNRMTWRVRQGDGSLVDLHLGAFRDDARWLHETVNQTGSARRAAAHERALKEQGKGGAFRAVPCPHCRATLDLTGWPRTPQAYCPYCETLLTLDGGGPPRQFKYRICDKCGYYGHWQEFTRLHLVILPYVIHWKSWRYTTCSACMRRQAWGMLLVNLVFVAGVPFSLVQLVRAYLGGWQEEAWFGELDQANQLARKGRVEAASEKYAILQQRLIRCAGIHYNRGQMLQAAGQFDQAAGCCRDALNDCSNYPFAYARLRQCLEQLGRTADVEGLDRQWQARQTIA